jgi:hypothetical protein
VFAIPGIGTFTLLPRRSVSYLDSGGYDLTVEHIRGGRGGVIVSLELDDLTRPRRGLLTA